MSMTMILLTVSVGCNLWFLFLLLYDRIMETMHGGTQDPRLSRFLIFPGTHTATVETGGAD